MSNTYFKIKKQNVYEPFDAFPGYTNNMELSVTAFVAGPGKHGVQLTCNTLSTLPSQSGKGYITLDSREEIEALINALQQRLDGNISATGNEQLPYIGFE